MSIDYNNLESGRPSTSNSKHSRNDTMTSNFTVETVDVDELRQNLA